MNPLMNRPRRNRKSAAIRNLTTETRLHIHDFIYPLFVIEGERKKEPIESMPDCYRYSIDMLIEEAKEAHALGIQAIALFPAIAERKKDSFAKESKNPNGLLQTAIKALKTDLPELAVITDVAMDPYSSDGHDGVVKDGKILNDETLKILGEMALSQAKAGADIVAPSDMMDGRVGYIREILDKNGFEEVGILAYSAKYASSFYGPFRDALDSAPKEGDKKTYQMNPANQREAIREILLDIDEGADMVMIKPALSYLDIISQVKKVSDIPVAAYHVSGEYAMVKAAGKLGWLDEKEAMEEVLLSIKRAGADIILSYYAKEIARSLS